MSVGEGVLDVGGGGEGSVMGGAVRVGERL